MDMTDSAPSTVGAGDGGDPKTLGSVIGHATVAVPVCSRRDSAGSTLEVLGRRELEEVRRIVILEHQRPVGLVSIEDLLVADADKSLGDLMREEFPLVTFDADEELAAQALVDGTEVCLVVVGPGGGFAGLVFADQLLPVVLSQQEQDLARLGGYLAGSREARTAADEPVIRRLWHRMPWLIIGLLGAMVSAVLMGAFEGRLQSNLLIALFVPAVVYMADAVGTQTETLLIRGLAVGVTVREVLVKELLTGALVGLFVGVAFTAFAFVGWGDFDVAIAVGLALFASATIATGLAMVLPATFRKLGIDPAFGSGPLATVVQDLLSILVYFLVVGLVVF